MQRFFAVLILAGTAFVGCRTDSGSRASSKLDQSADAAQNFAPSPSPSPSPQPNPANSHPGPDPRPLLVCFGDSLTAGFGADEGQSYPDFLQKDLDADGFHYRVVNEGISGNTTKDGVERLPEIAAMKPAVVVLEFGGNDGLRGLKVQTTRANLATMVASLQRAGAKVLLAGITLPPDYGGDYVTSFTATYPILARRYRVPLLPFILKDVYGVPGLMQADNVHATNKGNEVVARNILPLVEPLLKKNGGLSR